MKELIEKFIKENKLDLSETGSALNSTCCILSGYALHLGIDDVGDFLNLFIDTSSSEFDEESTKVFLFAKRKDYGKWWSSEEAKKQYIF